MKGVSRRVRVQKKVKSSPVHRDTVNGSAGESAVLAPESQVKSSQEEVSITPPPQSLSCDGQQDTSEDVCLVEESTDKGPPMFEDLCERMLSALCLVQTSLSEVLDVKDELVSQNVPSSIQTQLSLSTSRLFRSMLDLYVPSTELVRLVRVFGPEWEQKRQILNQLQGENERHQRLLSLALRRVQILEAQTQHFKDWERFSARLVVSHWVSRTPILQILYQRSDFFLRLPFI
ncbi:uncharacterized protein RCH25_052747 [Pelodytes ibericus]